MIPIKKNRIYFVVWLTIGALLTYACSAAPETDSTRLTAILASEDGCVAPCWQSIIPGKSTEEDLLAVVDHPSSSEFKNLRTGQLRPIGTAYLWENEEHEVFMQVRLDDSKVSIIEFKPFHNDFNLKMFTDFLGQPDAYGASILYAEQSYVILTLIYESRGSIIETWLSITYDQLQIVETTCEFEIDWNESQWDLVIYFVEPGPADEIVQNNLIDNFFNSEYKPQVWTSSMPIKLTVCP